MTSVSGEIKDPGGLHGVRRVYMAVQSKGNLQLNSVRGEQLCKARGVGN